MIKRRNQGEKLPLGFFVNHKRKHKTPYAPNDQHLSQLSLLPTPKKFHA